MSETKTYPLRLPRSLKDAVERISKEEGTSINQFVAMAVAEKVSALETASFFQERKARADFKTFDRIMKRRWWTAASHWRRDQARPITRIAPRLLPRHDIAPLQKSKSH